ncbi:MAG: hypothetical protein PQJ46_00625, partial [Spirochaetales bacterium]|nr:hypothetical protein [Spirochaetales bacterium]
SNEKGYIDLEYADYSFSDKYEILLKLKSNYSEHAIDKYNNYSGTEYLNRKAKVYSNCFSDALLFLVDEQQQVVTENTEKLQKAVKVGAIQSEYNDLNDRKANNDLNYRAYLNGQIFLPKDESLLFDNKSSITESLDDTGISGFTDESFIDANDKTNYFIKNEELEAASLFNAGTKKIDKAFTQLFGLLENSAANDVSTKFYESWGMLFKGDDSAFTVPASLPSLGEKVLETVYQEAATAWNRELNTLESLKQILEKLGNDILIITTTTVKQREAERDSKKAVLDVQRDLVSQALENWKNSVSTFSTDQEAYNATFKKLNTAEAAYNEAKYAYEKAEAVYEYSSTAYLGEGLDDTENASDYIPIDPSESLFYALKKQKTVSAAYDALYNLYSDDAEIEDFINRDEEYRNQYTEYRTHFTRTLYWAKLKTLCGEKIAEQKEKINEKKSEIDTNLDNNLVSNISYSLDDEKYWKDKAMNWIDYYKVDVINGVLKLVVQDNPTGKFLSDSDGNYIYKKIENNAFVNEVERNKYFYFGGTVQGLIDYYGFTENNANDAYDAYKQFCGNSDKPETYDDARRSWADSFQQLIEGAENTDTMLKEWSLALWYANYIEANGKKNNNATGLDEIKNSIWSTTFTNNDPESFLGAKAEKVKESTLSKYKEGFYITHLKEEGERCYNALKDKSYFEFFRQASQMNSLKISDKTEDNFIDNYPKIILLDEAITAVEDTQQNFIVLGSSFLVASHVAAGIATALLPIYFAAAVFYVIAAGFLVSSICAYVAAGSSETVSKELKEMKTNNDTGGGISISITEMINASDTNKKLNKELLDEEKILHELEGMDGDDTEVTINGMKSAIKKSLAMENKENKENYKEKSLKEYLGITTSTEAFIKKSQGITELTDDAILEYLSKDYSAKVETSGKDLIDVMGQFTLIAEESTAESESKMNIRVDKLYQAQQESEVSYTEAINNLDKYIEENSVFEAGGLTEEDQEYKELLAILNNAAAAAYRNSSYVSRSHQRRIAETKLELSTAIDTAEQHALKDFYLKQLSALKTQYLQMYSERLLTMRQLKQSQWKQMEESMKSRKEVWNSTIAAINRRGSREWTAANRKMSTARKEWLNNLQATYSDKTALWEESYKSLLERKAEWVEDLAVKTTLAGSENINMEDISLSAKNALAESTKDAVLEWSSEAADPSSILDSLTGGIFKKLIDTAKSSQNIVQNTSYAVNGYMATNLDDNGVQKLIADFAGEDREELENALMEITAKKALQTIADGKDGLLKMITNANSSVESSLNDQFYDAGYAIKNGKYTKKVLADSTSFGGEDYIDAEIDMYKDFEVPSEVENFNIGNGNTDTEDTMFEGLSSEAINRKINNALKSLKDLRESIFGKDEKRGESKTYETLVGSDTTVEDKEKQFLFIKWTEAEEKSEAVTTLREVEDGSFNEWVGYSPVLKSVPDNLMTSTTDEFLKNNVKYEGSGEMGKIMLDYMRFSMIENRGWTEFAKPWDEKRIFDDDCLPDELGLVKGLTVDGIVDMSASIALNIVCGPYGSLIKVGLDAVDVVDDLAYGRDVGETFVDFGKDNIKAGISFAASYAGGAISNSLSSSSSWLTEAGVSLGESVVTGQCNSLIDSIDYSGANGWDFNSDYYLSSTLGTEALAGYASTFVSSAVGSGLNDVVGGVEAGFWKGAIDTGAGLSGKAASLGVYALSSEPGTSFSEIWDESGGLSLNIAD